MLVSIKIARSRYLSAIYETTREYEGKKMDDLAMTVEDQHVVSAMWARHLFQQQEEIRAYQAQHRRIRMPGMILGCICAAVGMLNIGAGSSVFFLSAGTDEGLMLVIVGLAVILISIPINLIITKLRRNSLETQHLQPSRPQLQSRNQPTD
ncbi:MAG: hypothetical protein LKF41_06830 [Bifidobacterium sp.]|jgi:magnesium-transporting ATPase (P-type)|nr:hypothetical protein [Bifidobacterium sp.]MCH4175556.1 hypothetical protein [Bifidobacterium sp.]